jgi:enoyl-CoA hydratase
MSYENLLFETSEQIARITFNRPAALNALNRKTVEELGAALDAVRGDESIRALILTGAGEKAFVAGADIKELAAQLPVQGKETSLFGQGVFRRLETMGIPSIAAINGFALGGGCELALACTLRIASRTARLGQPEVKLGIIPGYGGSQRLARLCGKGVAHELILTGDVISAEEALRIGLGESGGGTGGAIAGGRSDSQENYCERAAGGEVFDGSYRTRIRNASGRGDVSGSDACSDWCCATEDMREGTRAFVEKRPAKFQGK